MNNFLQCQVWNGESVCKSNDDLDLFERSCRVWVVRLKVEIALVFDFFVGFWFGGRGGAAEVGHRCKIAEWNKSTVTHSGSFQFRHSVSSANVLVR
jgi:hypothetical protein